MSSKRLVARVRQHFDEHGAFKMADWERLFALQASHVRPNDGEVFLATTFDVIDGKLEVGMGAPFLIDRPGQSKLRHAV